MLPRYYRHSYGGKRRYRKKTSVGAMRLGVKLRVARKKSMTYLDNIDNWIEKGFGGKSSDGLHADRRGGTSGYVHRTIDLKDGGKLHVSRYINPHGDGTGISAKGARSYIRAGANGQTRRQIETRPSTSKRGGHRFSSYMQDKKAPGEHAPHAVGQVSQRGKRAKVRETLFGKSIEKADAGLKQGWSSRRGTDGKKIFNIKGKQGSFEVQSNIAHGSRKREIPGKKGDVWKITKPGRAGRDQRREAYRKIDLSTKSLNGWIDKGGFGRKYRTHDNRLPDSTRGGGLTGSVHRIIKLKNGGELRVSRYEAAGNPARDKGDRFYVKTDKNGKTMRGVKTTATAGRSNSHFLSATYNDKKQPGQTNTPRVDRHVWGGKRDDKMGTRASIRQALFGRSMRIKRESD